MPGTPLYGQGFVSGRHQRQRHADLFDRSHHLCEPGQPTSRSQSDPLGIITRAPLVAADYAICSKESAPEPMMQSIGSIPRPYPNCAMFPSTGPIKVDTGTRRTSFTGIDVVGHELTTRLRSRYDGISRGITWGPAAASTRRQRICLVTHRSLRGATVGAAADSHIADGWTFGDRRFHASLDVHAEPVAFTSGAGRQLPSAALDDPAHPSSRTPRRPLRPRVPARRGWFPTAARSTPGFPMSDARPPDSRRWAT